MIKIGILGADSLIAGELLRLLILHPEVEITTLWAPSLRGRLVSSHHKGIIGDISHRFTDQVDLQSLDLVFITSPDLGLGGDLVIPDHLKVIYVQDEGISNIPTPFDRLEFVPGVSEMFRKPLVRGARASKIMSSPTTLALILLFPLALHLLLNNSIRLLMKMPVYKSGKLAEHKIEEKISSLLHEVQLSFEKIKELKIESSDTLRAVSVEAEFPCNVAEEEIEKIYSNIYDDHNFTFVVNQEPSPSEVASTHKCLIYVEKPDENTLRVKAVADGVLRGGAGDAIHAMNLLFGLFEKTGLTFPAGLAYVNESKQ